MELVDVVGRQVCPSAAATFDGFNFFSAVVALSTPSTTDRM